VPDIRPLSSAIGNLSSAVGSSLTLFPSVRQFEQLYLPYFEVPLQPEISIACSARGRRIPTAGTFVLLGSRRKECTSVQAEGRVRWAPHESINHQLKTINFLERPRAGCNPVKFIFSFFAVYP
jgi:hypothetical protein